MAKILLENTCFTVSEWLAISNHKVDVVNTGEDAVHYMEAFSYDIILLDWEMPGLSGVDVCRKFRDRGGTTPLLMLTGRKAIEHKEEGLDAGADDYLTKPFDVRELGARIRALLRRPTQLNVDALNARNISLDPKSRKVHKDGREIPMQPMEYALLEFFMKHPNEVFKQEMLLRRLWDSDAEVSPEAIYSCIRRVRKKLDDPGEKSIISSVYGAGYRFEP